MRVATMGDHSGIRELSRAIRTQFVQFGGGAPNCTPTSVVARGPRDIWVESTDRCNTRCVHCRHFYSKFGQDMSPALFEQIVQEVLPDTERVVLNGYGEPLLAQHFDAMFDICARNGSRLEIISNGLLLRDRGRVSRLAKANVRLGISVDGAARETYNSIRPLIEWDHVLEALSCIRDVRRDHNIARHFYFLILFCAMKRNIAELPEIVQLASDYGACEVEVLPLGCDEFREEVRGESLDDSPELVSPAFMKAIPLAHRLGVKLHAPPSFKPLIREGRERRTGLAAKLKWLYRSVFLAYYSARERGLLSWLGNRVQRALRRSGTPFGRCRMPWDSAYFRSDGAVYPCCVLMDKMGDLNSQRWEDIWNGRLYQSLRRTVHGWNPAKGCRCCPMKTGIHGGDDRAYQKYFARFQIHEIPIEKLASDCWQGFYNLEYYDGRPFLRWMTQTGTLTLPRKRGARFLRLVLSACPGSMPGRCTINSGATHHFDTSCETITFPLAKSTGPCLHVKLEMESVWRIGDDPRDLGLPIRGIAYLS